MRDADPGTPEIRRQRTSAEYQAAVAAAIEEIKAGEAFQIVPSQRFEADCPADALDVYRVLRRRNPSPYLYLLRLDGFAIVGSSPEALVKVTGGRATTHPIAGTRPRGADASADAVLEAELLADPKEAAEHLMLVDLGRNDLGRVCRPGTVEVVEFMKVRRYSHVMHLEAAVSGTLTPGKSALDATLSCFPGRHPLRGARRCGRWRSSTASRCRGAACTAAWWATSTSPVTPTPPSRSAPPSSGTGSPTSRPVPGWWPTRSRPTRTPRVCNKAAAVLGAVAEAAEFTRLEG